MTTTNDDYRDLILEAIDLLDRLPDALREWSPRWHGVASRADELAAELREVLGGEVNGERLDYVEGRR